MTSDLRQQLSQALLTATSGYPAGLPLPPGVVLDALWPLIESALAQAHATIERMAVDAEAHHVVLAQARREALEDAIVMLRPLRKFAVSVMTVEEKAAAFDELCAASAPPALAAEHPWIGSMPDAPQPDEPDEHDLERMDADAFTRAAASVPKERKK